MDYSADHGGLGSERSDAAGDAEAAWGLAQLMDELAHGVLVVSLQRLLLHANRAARHALARRRVLLVEQRTVLCCCPEQGRRLQDALSRIAQGKRSLLTLSGPDGDSLTLAVIPLRDGASRPDRAALVFSRASVCESLMLGFFARSHGLTRTEELVLGILCHGFSAPEIAAQMKVAVSTVRSHVRSLCAKTRSSGVRELVNRVAVLPPVAPSLYCHPMH
jgi:DNA-binding CsgD family transcriptional regulator